MALNPNRVYGFNTGTNRRLTAACRFEPGKSSGNRGLTVKHWRYAKQEDVNGANDTSQMREGWMDQYRER
jgi:hypothetical protein